MIKLLYKRMSVLIADPDVDFTNHLRRIIADRTDVTVCASTTCADLVLMLTCEKKPQILIVNPDMFNAGKTVFFTKLRCSIRSNLVIVVTAACNIRERNEIQNNFENTVFMEKPLELDFMLDLVRDLAIKNTDYCIEEEKDSKYTNNLYLVKKITVLLHELGVPAHLSGYNYLRDAICMVVENPMILSNMHRRVYSIIGEKEGKKPANVEKSIRTAIEVSLLRCNPELLKEYFGYTINSEKGKPTNSEYIAMLADRYTLWLA